MWTSLFLLCIVHWDHTSASHMGILDTSVKSQVIVCLRGEPIYLQHTCLCYPGGGTLLQHPIHMPPTMMPPHPTQNPLDTTPPFSVVLLAESPARLLSQPSPYPPNPRPHSPSLVYSASN
jgi:hypothetical protein